MDYDFLTGIIINCSIKNTNNVPASNSLQKSLPVTFFFAFFLWNPLLTGISKLRSKKLQLWKQENQIFHLNLINHEKVSNSNNSSIIINRINVANIMPDDTIEVELKYTELLRPIDNIYEFVYPAVVGPRYVSSGDDLAALDEGWTANPYLEERQEAPYEYHMSVR